MNADSRAGRLTPGADAVAIRMLCMPGLQAAMGTLGPQFENATGHHLSIQFTLPAHSLEALQSGAFDAVAFNTNAVDDLAAEHKVLANPRVAIARMGIGVAPHGSPGKTRPGPPRISIVHPTSWPTRPRAV
jgi:Bacterial extracellular solute-binding protein